MSYVTYIIQLHSFGGIHSQPTGGTTAKHKGHQHILVDRLWPTQGIN